MSHAYTPRRTAISREISVRGLQIHLLQWGQPASGRPLRVFTHGYMDIGASFQFVVDAMTDDACVLAPDWRGFGRSQAPPGTDAYWFADYLGDLDGLLQAVSPDAAVDLLGHSMGGNIVMAYAGVRPARVRRLVNLEGFGLPDLPPAQAPARLAQWLDELRQPQRLKDYASLDEVAARLRQNNPRLPTDKSVWLAGQWAQPTPDGRWALRADAAHRRVNPVPYRAAEAVAAWAAISASLLWVQGRASHPERWWGGRYSLTEFEARLAVVPRLQRLLLDDAGHMLHHDQPEALALALMDFLA